MPARKPTKADRLLGPVDSLWDSVLVEYLAEPLWIERDAYDAGQVLMVPLHAAVVLEKADWVDALRGHFEQLDTHLAGGGALPSSRLARFQYLFLVTRAGALAGDRFDLVPERLRVAVANELRSEWRDLRGRILDKLAYGPLRPTAKASVSDGLLFPLALAADLGACGDDLDDRLAEEAVDLAAAIVASAGVEGEDGGWVFQPEALRDHPDYAYAGRTEKSHGMAPRSATTGAWDSSHGARFPLWLRSFERAAGSEGGRPFRRALNGLRRQFVNAVIEPPGDGFPLPRLRNYLDGANGVYRWGYDSIGPDAGYGPYELSGILTLGWWSFLGGKRVAKTHSQIAASFPLPDDVIELYCGPITGRRRNPTVREPASYHNGLRELLTRLAAVLALEVGRDSP